MYEAIQNQQKTINQGRTHRPISGENSTNDKNQRVKQYIKVQFSHKIVAVVFIPASLSGLMSGIALNVCQAIIPSHQAIQDNIP